MFEVDHAKFEEGRAAYARGASVQGLAEAVEREWQKQETAYAEGKAYLGAGNAFDRQYEIASKSLMLGFVDGLVSDIRKIAGGVKGGLRA